MLARWDEAEETGEAVTVVLLPVPERAVGTDGLVHHGETVSRHAAWKPGHRRKGQ
jgi:hypothetical protein